MKQEELQRKARRELSALNIVGIPDVSAVRKAKEKLESQKTAKESHPSEDKPTVVESTTVNPTTVKNTTVESTTVKNTTVDYPPESKIDIRNNYHKFDNDVSDILAKDQTPIEQAIYHRLYRLSYGYNKNTCQVGMGALARACNIGSSSKTVKKAIQGLIDKEHIMVLEDHQHNVKGTKYRIFLPCEVPNIESSTVVESTIVNNTVVDATVVNNTIVDANPTITSDDATVVNNTVVGNTTVDPTVVESTVVYNSDTVVNNTTVKNTTVPVDPLLTGIDATVVNSTVVNLAPFKDKERQFKNTLSPGIYNILINIIGDFYKKVGQSKITREKRERAEINIQELLAESFSPEDIQFAVEWTLENAKEKPYDFSMIKHTIGQAMAEKEKVEAVKARKAKRAKEAKQKKAEEEKQKAQEELIKNHKEGLSKRERTKLRKMAEAEIRDSGQFKAEFITEHLIEAKENEILAKKLENKSKPNSG